MPEGLANSSGGKTLARQACRPAHARRASVRYCSGAFPILSKRGWRMRNKVRNWAAFPWRRRTHGTSRQTGRRPCMRLAASGGNAATSTGRNSCCRRAWRTSPTAGLHAGNAGAGIAHLPEDLFETLQSNLDNLDFSHALPDVMTIADEVESQLTEAMNGYMKVQPEISGIASNGCIRRNSRPNCFNGNWGCRRTRCSPASSRENCCNRESASSADHSSLPPGLTDFLGIQGWIVAWVLLSNSPSLANSFRSSCMAL